ncbi:MAG: hypothetical protein NTX70_00670 [Verrucomicrobia bacterium]|jgi:hypothetical protein|nr:hypothetical protein [Verrucomicrobiota bacterium]
MKLQRLAIASIAIFAMASLEASPLRDALAMIETGASSPVAGDPDHVIGGSGEVSRFQIMPVVWRAYTKSRNHTNPEVAWTVTRRILADRVGGFEKATGRSPEPIEVYLLWNKPGHFEGVGYRLERVSRSYRDRAQRFHNLYRTMGGGPVTRPTLTDEVAPNR